MRARVDYVARLIRLLTAVAVAAGLVLAIPAAYALIHNLGVPEVYDKDFSQEYLLAWVVRTRGDPTRPIVELAAQYASPVGYMQKLHPTPHPPPLGLLALPLSWLSYPSAAAVWLGVELACLVLSVAALGASVGAPRRWVWMVVLPLALLGWPQVVLDLALGQLTVPLLCLLAGSQAALLTRRPGLGGGLLGLALVIKPLAWTWLLVLAARRAWRACLVSLGVVAAAYAVTGAWLGLGVLLTYFSQVLPDLSVGYRTETTNLSLWTLGPRLFGGMRSGSLAGTPPLAGQAEVGQVLSILVPLATLALACVWMVRCRPPLARALGVMTCVGLLANPISWQFYLVLAALPAAQVALAVHRGQLRGGLALVGVLSLLLLLPRLEDWLGLAGGFPPSVWLQVLMLAPTLGLAGLAVVLAAVN